MNSRTRSLLFAHLAVLAAALFAPPGAAAQSDGWVCEVDETRVVCVREGAEIGGSYWNSYSGDGVHMVWTVGFGVPPEVAAAWDRAADPADCVRATARFRTEAVGDYTDYWEQVYAEAGAAWAEVEDPHPDDWRHAAIEDARAERTRGIHEVWGHPWHEEPGPAALIAAGAHIDEIEAAIRELRLAAEAAVYGAYDRRLAEIEAEHAARMDSWRAPIAAIYDAAEAQVEAWSAQYRALNDAANDACVPVL